MSNQVLCKICGRSFSNKGIGTHVWRCHGAGVDFNPNDGYSKGSRVAWNKGLTKEISEAVERQSKSLQRKKSDLELELDDDGKLLSKYRNKCVNALKESIRCLLSFDEFCILVKEAGLVSSQIGFCGDKYVLARYNDEGDYVYGNCRFIRHIENAHERELHTTHTRIRCIEDGVEFNSVKSASLYYRVHVDTIFSAIREKNGHVPSINKTFEKIIQV